MYNHDNNEPITSINVTPLVDIVLVLLIIFMVTAKLILSPSVKVDLPNVTAGEKTEESILNIMLSEDGRIFLNDHEVQMTTLKQEIEAIENRRGGVVPPDFTHAIVAADKKVSHGQFMELLDIIRSAGITKFSINVETPQLLSSQP